MDLQSKYIVFSRDDSDKPPEHDSKCGASLAQEENYVQMRKVIDVIEGNHPVLCKVLADQNALYTRDKSGSMDLRFKLFKMKKR